MSSPMSPAFMASYAAADAKDFANSLVREMDGRIHEGFAKRDQRIDELERQVSALEAQISILTQKIG